MEYGVIHLVLHRTCICLTELGRKLQGDQNVGNIYRCIFVEIVVTQWSRHQIKERPRGSGAAIERRKMRFVGYLLLQ